jgi:hypothetical protein
MALRLFADARREGRAVDPADTIAITTTLLDRALGDIGQLGRVSSPRWTDIDSGLEHVRQMWSGLVAISWSIDGAEPRSQPMVDDVVEFASELVTNASRHGDARRVDIAIRGLDVGTVELVSVDDGRGPVGSPTAGAGLGALGRRGGSWEIARDAEQRTRVRVLLRERVAASTW